MTFKKKKIYTVLFLAFIVVLTVGCNSSKNTSLNNKGNLTAKNTSKKSTCGDKDCNMSNCSNESGKQNSTATSTVEIAGTTKTIKIKGMDCAECVKKIETSLSKINNLKVVKVNIGNAVISIKKDVNESTIKDSIEKDDKGKATGYTVIGIS